MTPTAKSRFLYGVKSPTNLRGAVFSVTAIMSSNAAEISGRQRLRATSGSAIIAVAVQAPGNSPRRGSACTSRKSAAGIVEMRHRNLHADPSRLTAGMQPALDPEVRAFGPQPRLPA